MSASETPPPPDPKFQQSKYYKEVKLQLQHSFGLEDFRPNQLEAITAAMEGRDVFVLMPTGGGKSLCYQLPAVCQSGSTRGVTVVVSPLLALMKDQVESLRQKNIDTFLWNGDTLYEDAQNRMYNDPPPKLMYVTPEKLKESGVVNKYLSTLYNQKQLARFVIDEAHCISTWGQDFREAYQGLGSLRDSYPNTPMMALTATANQTTSDDIIHKLKMRNTAVFQQSFNRLNLTYYIKEKKKNSVVSDIAAYIKAKHYGKTGVIYCLGRDKCEFVADKLRQEGLKATHFHAKMLSDEKDEAMAAWMAGTCHIVVATIAFGMGIDKADVRFVIHHDMPKSIDGYYQETGRAGRDGLPADCVLYYNFADFKSIQRMIEAVEPGKPRPLKDVTDRQIGAARKVVEYCSNTVTCRRVLLLHYFGEVFESKNCKRHCDNCMNDIECLSQNVTDEAKCAAELVKSFRDADEMVTVAQSREILRGAKTQDIQRKKHDRFPMYGKAAGLPPELLEQMLMRLLFMEVLVEVSMPTSSGFHASYVAVSSIS
ncbi:ATP-dependent DNA helicase [Pluteus cervinus]|uniref:ATP-dependent DNA helicase n=1 Tax=Pluteus cervinus TaxID=181527 RepID=A0ACD3AQZ1_9AGAR|nr:ATP-dependent DNA helicase [Pluteus cervinus]